ncbi:hypothetical protein HPB50_004233 [Hyalomma asiaticum]|uniref:Uncharacterized protein n=1 Tax=Hyalomma asiaticum TaxID=266040 RepID=A0ACB7T879_HYAAI|nr:hypothetical protein HPB50_004233 [Hyalomma asiaticum]
MALKESSLVQVIDGDCYSSVFDADKIREALRFTPGRGDVVQMSYPASGTHWMHQMVQLIVHGGQSATCYEEFRARHAFLELVGKPAEARSPPSPRLLMTHIRPGKIAMSAEAKYIYVARNPWDVCGSLYDFLQQRHRTARQQSFEDFVNTFLHGLVPGGDYFEHVRAGYMRRDEQNVFFVTYEEMAAHRDDVLLRLADFLGRDYGHALRENSELLSEIMDKCSSEYMKDIFATSTQKIDDLVRNSGGSWHGGGDGNRKVKFVRIAKVGRWRNMFSKRTLEKTLRTIDSLPEPPYVQELWKDIYSEVCDATH